MSDVIELVGLACLAVAAFLRFGVVGGLVAAGVELIAYAVAMDGKSAEKSPKSSVVHAFFGRRRAARLRKAA